MFPLAAQQLNVWWLVGALLCSLADHSWRVLQIGVPMVGRDDFNRIVGFRPIWIALPAFALFTMANLYYLVIHLRAGRRWAVFWSAALEVLGYNMLMIYTHENHLFSFFVYTLPLIALGNKLVPRLFWMLSTIYALNLFLFQGLGTGLEADGHWLRILPGFDLTIFIAMVNVGIFLLLLRAKNWWFDQVGWAPNTPGQAN
jgi:hypothetical protein